MLIDVGDGELDVSVVGSGPLVILVPSLGRGSSDFVALAAALAHAGHRVASPEPRGIAPTTAPLGGLTMKTLADDIAEVGRTLGGGEPFVVLGHAFGNRVARMTATEHGSLVRGVALLACGGTVPPAPSAAAALTAVFDETLSDDEHRANVATAFFADGNDPSVWDDGWHPAVARAQGQASRAQDPDHWFAAGDAPVLIVQPAQDVIAVPENATRIVAALGTRARLVIVEGAGHALLPEQPDAVARTVIEWLESHP